MNAFVVWKCLKIQSTSISGVSVYAEEKQRSPFNLIEVGSAAKAIVKLAVMVLFVGLPDVQRRFGMLI